MNRLSVDLIVPSLNKDRARETGQRARVSAGYPSTLFVAYDKDRSGFTKTVNNALRKTQSPFVCLLNDDARPFTSGWLRHLVNALIERPNAGFAGVSGNCRTRPQAFGLPGSPYGVIEVGHVAFFCTLIRRRALEDVKYLDEKFIHYGSDVDVQWRAKRHGWKSVWVRHVYVYHDLGDFIQPWKNIDQETFDRRWK